jgi:hypothetical protein
MRDAEPSFLGLMLDASVSYGPTMLAFDIAYSYSEIFLFSKIKRQHPPPEVGKHPASVRRRRTQHLSSISIHFYLCFPLDFSFFTSIKMIISLGATPPKGPGALLAPPNQGLMRRL